MLRLYNTLTKRVEPFSPITPAKPGKPGVVTIYSCGPTVYNYQHIGNMRKYLHDDFLVRVLLRQGYAVRRIVNITDVGHLTQDDFDLGEDKIVAAARKEGKSPLAIAEFYTAAFLKDCDKLQITPPESYIRATDHIPEMLRLAEQLIKKKHAYVSEGSVYFDVQSFAEYGKLSGNSIDDLKERVRTELQDSSRDAAFEQKKHPVDFALWIKANPRHLLQWPSPWGAGYPGWHIECAAMILKHFGPSIDIHTGGEDHIFPHHEDEIAEAEAATGKPLARVWMHIRHLLLNAEKMAKRTGKFVRVDDLEKQGFNPLAFRYLVLSTHYRARMNFTWASLKAATEGWKRYVDVGVRLREAQAQAEDNGAVSAELTRRLKRIKTDFDAALNDDLATPRALAAVSEFIGVANTHLSGHNSLAISNALLEQLLSFEQVLALLPPAEPTALDPTLAKEIADLERLVLERQALRTQKKYAQADTLRDQIQQMGFSLKDTPRGIEWVKIRTGQRGTFAPKRG